MLPFASLGANQRQVSIVASTTSDLLAEEQTEENSTRLAEIETSEAGSMEYKIWQLLNYASIDEENLNDKGNHTLAKLRAYSALQLLLETEVINEKDIDLTIARAEERTENRSETIADTSQPGLSIKLEPRTMFLREQRVALPFSLALELRLRGELLRAH